MFVVTSVSDLGTVCYTELLQQLLNIQSPKTQLYLILNEASAVLIPYHRSRSG